MGKGLSAEDVAALREAVAARKPAPVWFTGAAVGVDEGAAGKVIAFDDAAEGDFIQVKPAGSRDAMSFSPAELTTEKPAAPPAPRRPAPAPFQAPPVEDVTDVVVGIEGGEPEPRRRRSAPAKKQQQHAVEITVTLHATPDGEWSVDVLVGKKRTVRWAPVAAGEVGRLAKHLPAEVGEAISVALDAAKDRQTRRVAELKAELEAAQRALRDLG
ncbi:DUF6319 family protein [Actinokineospora bangkokensis]|uniref:Uncharacterized protein n=1 Tax=Actinokineospora bangkokensis TaxID=1193682 RepID=A0A1Q9LSH1_9PSEU|nr:DUF6319 family protein [Actinokineospora bangkokensis]OLR94982.1 hypothetical protein BJP25_08420 [Actinokineospora bangkokensis]